MTFGTVINVIAEFLVACYTVSKIVSKITRKSEQEEVYGRLSAAF